MLKEKIKIKGLMTCFKLRGDIDEKTKFKGVKIVDLLRQYIITRDRTILSYLTQIGAVLSFSERSNLIVTVGRAVLAERLAGGTTYTGEINYGALGTGTTAPTNADTTLETEVFRKIVSSQAFDENIAYIDFFYTASDVNGTFEEFGNFIDGAAGADTGQLFSRIITGGWVKSASESLFVSCQYTIS